MVLHDLARFVESSWQWPEVTKRALVRDVKQRLLEPLRPHVDAWPISDDAIIRCSLGNDTAGKPIPAQHGARFKALAVCAHIEESSEWNELLERKLVTALYRCAEQQVAQAHAADARVVVAVRGGYLQRQDARDRSEVRGYAKDLFDREPCASKAEFLMDMRISPFRAKYRDTTLWDWAKELKPGVRRPGRPKKNK
jgi:hypothetical protein